jgi:monoamine oxidase
VLCVSPLVLRRIAITPGWPGVNAFALQNTFIGMQSRVLLVPKGRLCENDVSSINLETGDARMCLLYETAVSAMRCSLENLRKSGDTSVSPLGAFILQARHTTLCHGARTLPRARRSRVAEQIHAA